MDRKKIAEGRLKTMLKLYGGQMNGNQIAEFALLLGIYDGKSEVQKSNMGTKRPIRVSD